MILLLGKILKQILNKLKKLCNKCGAPSQKNTVFLWKKNVSVENATFFNIKKDMEFIFDKANLKANKGIQNEKSIVIFNKFLSKTYFFMV